MAGDVGEYIDGLQPPIRALAERVRGIITEELPEAQEAIKWSQPLFVLDGKNVCYLRGAKAHLTVGFVEGKRLSDPDGLLEGGGQQMAHLKLKKTDDLDEARLRAWLREAASLT